MSQPGLTKGSDQVRAGENLNPVKTLRMRYDNWVRAGSPRLPAPPPTLYVPK